MPWTPPGVQTKSLAPGQHQVYVVDLKEITDPDALAKFLAQYVLIVMCHAIDDGTEADLIIKFSGSRFDLFAGLNVERLHQAAGIDVPDDQTPINPKALLAALRGVPMMLDINDKGFASTIAPIEMNEETI